MKYLLTSPYISQYMIKYINDENDMISKLHILEIMYKNELYYLQHRYKKQYYDDFVIDWYNRHKFIDSEYNIYDNDNSYNNLIEHQLLSCLFINVKLNNINNVKYICKYFKYNMIICDNSYYDNLYYDSKYSIIENIIEYCIHHNQFDIIEILMNIFTLQDDSKFLIISKMVKTLPNKQLFKNIMMDLYEDYQHDLSPVIESLI